MQAARLAVIAGAWLAAAAPAAWAQTDPIQPPPAGVYQEINGFLTGGVRILGQSVSTDLGLMLPIWSGEPVLFPFVPVVNVVWAFGRR